MKNAFSLIAAAGLASVVNAHMEMVEPAPFRSKENPHTTDIDYSMKDPLDKSGSNFPCKGYHELLDTDQGASVADWTPGESYTIKLDGSARHDGGSCQASLSYDEGSSWTVVHSWIGGCPLTDDWTFTLPGDAPSGDALFAWSWHNKIGNREMYMNCAHVTIQEGGGDAENSFDSRPALFEANIDNGCSTVEGTDVKYPNPGPDVTSEGDSEGDPEGSCGGAQKRQAMSFRA